MAGSDSLCKRWAVLEVGSVKVHFGGEGDTWACKFRRCRIVFMSVSPLFLASRFHPKVAPLPPIVSSFLRLLETWSFHPLRRVGRTCTRWEQLNAHQLLSFQHVHCRLP